MAFSSATRRLLDYIGPSKAVGARLSRHEKSPSSFVENRQHIRISLSDGLDYVERAIHPRILTRPIKAVNPQNVAGPSFPKPVAIQIHLFPQAYIAPVISDEERVSHYDETYRVWLENMPK